MSQSLPPPFTPDSEFAALETPRAPAGSLSVTALARFEFEAGKANDGTKILMIEWEDDDLARCASSPVTATSSSTVVETKPEAETTIDTTNTTTETTENDQIKKRTGGLWHVSWENKTAVLPASEQTNDHTRRIYFLLPPNVTIPPVVTLAYEPAPAGQQPNDYGTAASEMLQLNPLPAIFPPELGADGRSAGKKGVLHTIWAKKRLQVLEREIHEECQSNVEGIALQMALQEKEWIEMNFGVGGTQAAAEAVRNRVNSHDASYPMGPATPVSPTTGGRLGEKLKGLKLQTGAGGRKKEFTSSPLTSEGMCQSSSAHLLSPLSPDIAVSSFNSFHGIQRPEPAPAAAPAPVPPSVPALLDPVKTVAHYPPESLQAQQSTQDGSSGFAPMGTIAHTSGADSGEELFAKALSPRTPDLPRSPFSFAPETLLEQRM
ncbi:uncharacterized protein KD926_011487 [Aspergillus affinis]|uniref:uncharacterized protein n=1 Tax=Aspergillus affinis TaxID=1070780 RepID=UPI0022FE567B|nr:uncharacterized protein KD926_011487 [Aspergillus affinis]KAI9037875.1 hypothetical protein KD926_011487 [Aspergillus affinis]